MFGRFPLHVVNNAGYYVKTMMNMEVGLQSGLENQAHGT